MLCGFNQIRMIYNDHKQCTSTYRSLLYFLHRELDIFYLTVVVIYICWFDFWRGYMDLTERHQAWVIGRFSSVFIFSSFRINIADEHRFRLYLYSSYIFRVKVEQVVSFVLHNR